MTDVVIKRVSTLFLKAVILLIGAGVAVLCAYGFPGMFRELRDEPLPAVVIYVGLFGFYATAIPFFGALSRAFALLRLIDANEAFSEASVRALKAIKHCAVAMSALYATALPLAYGFAEQDDAPGLILLSTAVACAPLIVATFAAVLEKLIRSAVEMKAEHDFTV